MQGRRGVGAGAGLTQTQVVGAYIVGGGELVGQGGLAHAGAAEHRHFVGGDRGRAVLLLSLGRWIPVDDLAGYAGCVANQVTFSERNFLRIVM